MSDDTVEIPLIDSLQELLEDERTALLEGKLDALPDLLTRKEALFEELTTLQEEEEIDADDLIPLQEGFARNHQLLESAQAGLRATHERMGTMRRVRTTFESYDNRGQRQAVQLNAGQRVEKRA
ncbi:flagellar biosynthesis protein FlgN [uncultured Shimia sp.]|uniref:flagellar biosynthesis protein FlgN n=1 Tax=uncultured Shimia sp. TaxID=573152 RepID=UPI0025E50173|nr:flagellar biosynthesis protein FlgN [uncultured Shimia sp.]